MQGAAKLFAVLAITELTPVVLRWLLAETGSAALGAGRFITVAAAAFLWLTAISYTFAVWVGTGRKDGKSWLDKTAEQRRRFAPILVAAFAVALLLALLGVAVAKYDLSHSSGDFSSLALSGLFLALSLLGLKSSSGNLYMPPAERRMMHWIAERLTWEQAATFGLAVLAILLLIGVFQRGLMWQGMSSDATISAYASQTIAAGAAPYEKYVIMHPPMAYAPGALFLVVGRAIGLEDVIALRFGALAMALWSMYLVFLISLEFAGLRSAALIAAGSFGWLSLLVTTAYGSPTKIITMLVALLMIRAMQVKRWALVGVLSLALALTWAGAVVFAAIPAVVLCFHQASTRKSSVIRYLLGLGAAIGLLVLYLNSSHSTDLFVHQYLGGLVNTVGAKLGFGSPLNAAGVRGFSNLINGLQKFPVLDRMLMLVGLIGYATYATNVFRSGNTWGERLRHFIGDPVRSPILLIGLFAAGISAIDFQSIADVIPVIPSFCIIFAWLMTQLVGTRLPGADIHSRAWRYLYSGFMTTGLVVLQFIQPSPGFPTTLGSQRLASSWLDGLLEEGQSVQVIGNAFPLVMLQRENATRVVHLGPKTVLALRAEDMSLDQFADQLLAELPDYILVDRRNSEQPYLGEFLERLTVNYKVIRLTETRGEYALLYYLEGDLPALVLGSGMNTALSNPELLLAYQSISAGDYVAADNHLQHASQTDLRALNLSLILRGRLAALQGNESKALNFFEAASRRGQFKVWGNLEMGAYLLGNGRAADAEKYLTSVFSAPLPAAMEYRLPSLLTLSELLDLKETDTAVIGDSSWVVSYSLDRIDSSTVLATLWWWTAARDVHSAEASFEWIDANGAAIGLSEGSATFFYPGNVVRWSYLIPVPDGSPPDSFRIALTMEDGTVYYSTPLHVVFTNERGGVRVGKPGND